MARVRTRSGIMGWRERLRRSYSSLEEFKHYSSMYGLHKRLGFKSATAAWKADPMIEGSVIPSDFRRVKAKTRKRRVRANRYKRKAKKVCRRRGRVVRRKRRRIAANG